MKDGKMMARISCLILALLLCACMMSKKGSGESDSSADTAVEDVQSDTGEPDIVDPDIGDPDVDEPDDVTEVEDPVVEDPVVEDPVVEDPVSDVECTTDGDCDDGDPCTMDACAARSCTHLPLDADSDGHVSDACGGDDCDDSRSDTYLGAPEVCLDGVDQDCDTIVDGMLVMGADLRVSDMTSGLFSMTSSLAWSGSEYAVAWQDNREGTFVVYLARISDAGAKIGSDHRIEPSSGDPFLAWSGSEYGASWVAHSGSSFEIYFARVSASGSVLGSAAQLTDAAESSSGPSLAWNGSEYGLSWYDERDGNREIYFTRVSSLGTEVGSDVRITSDSASSDNVGAQSLVWTGSQYGASWCDDRDGTKEVYFARLLESGGKIGSDVRLTSAGAHSDSTALAWTGSEFGLVWTSDRDGNKEVYFARISDTGVKIGSDVRITTAVNDAEFPTLAWSGSEYGVSWNDERTTVDEGNIYFVRISPSGAIHGSEIRLTPHRSLMPSLVWTGSEYGVSWEDNRVGSFEIFFNRIGFCE
jgi:hypothetical protein